MRSRLVCGLPPPLEPRTVHRILSCRCPEGVLVQRRRLARLTVGLAAAQGAIWWLMPALRAQLPGDGIDETVASSVLRAILLALKPAVLILLAIDLGRVSSAVGQRTVSARRAALGWGIAWLAVLVPMILFRDPVADWTDCATSRLTSHAFRGYDTFFMTEDRERHARWLAGWAAGRFQLAELAFVPVYVSAQVLIAKAVRRWFAVILQAIATFVLGLMWIVCFDLVLITYDVDYEGILIGPVLVDLIYVVVPLRTESPLASALYLALAVTNRWILRAQH